MSCVSRHRLPSDLKRYRCLLLRDTSGNVISITNAPVAIAVAYSPARLQVFQPDRSRPGKLMVANSSWLIRTSMGSRSS